MFFVSKIILSPCITNIIKVKDKIINATSITLNIYIDTSIITVSKYYIDIFLPFALSPVTLYCPGPGPKLSILPLCLAPKLKAGALSFLDSDVFFPVNME